jgi:hypothetical protein
MKLHPHEFTILAQHHREMAVSLDPPQAARLLARARELERARDGAQLVDDLQAAYDAELAAACQKPLDATRPSGAA